ncbi:MAG: peptidoglycan-binding protein LysM [Pseudomonadaceae bacterium]|nr:peptidoglycan-binding protein LysM [Pseudomonadaceae bacterium]
MFDSLFDFAKDMGKKLFQSDADAAESILAHINSNNPGVDPLTVAFDDGVVTMTGAAINQPAKEKAVLMAGNVKGVEKVEADAVSVPPPPPAEPPPPPVQYYVIKSGDTLYGVAKEFYGNGMKYPEIFEANREVIEDPDKIYPGQKIRIPKQS